MVLVSRPAQALMQIVGSVQGIEKQQFRMLRTVSMAQEAPLIQPSQEYIQLLAMLQEEPFASHTWVSLLPSADHGLTLPLIEALLNKTVVRGRRRQRTCSWKRHFYDALDGWKWACSSAPRRPGELRESKPDLRVTL